MANDCFITGKTGHVLINGADLYEIERAKQHNLTRANVCGARIRYTGAPSSIHNFMSDPTKTWWRIIGSCGAVRLSLANLSPDFSPAHSGVFLCPLITNRKIMVGFTSVAATTFSDIGFAKCACFMPVNNNRLQWSCTARTALNVSVGWVRVIVHFNWCPLWFYSCIVFYFV